MSTLKKKGLSFALILVLLIGMLGGMNSYAATKTGDKVKITVNNIEYTFDLYDDSDGNFAYVRDVTNPESPTSAVMPDIVSYGGVEYEVTEIYSWVNSPYMDIMPGREGIQCANITSISLPDTLVSVNSVNLLKFASVKDFVIPGSIKIFNGKFQGCKNLENLTFNEGVKEINSNSMLSKCTALTEINLPDSLELISNNNTFNGAAALESISLPAGLKVADGKDAMFSGCTSLKNVTFRGDIDLSGGYSTFSGCTSLENITLPDSVTKICESMFSGCTSLAAVNCLGGITEIEKSAFSGCTDMTSIPVPDMSKVAVMGANAFKNCSNLTGDIDFSNLDEIPNNAFDHTAITGVTFSKSLKSIGADAFAGTEIKTASFPTTLTTIGANAFMDSSLEGTVVVPDSVTSIGAGAFKNTNIEEIHIGSGVSKIAAGTFDGISTLKKIVFNSSMDDVDLTGAIPGGVECEFLVESIDGEGDTINNEVNAKTLQDAVNDAGDNETIVLEKNVQLENTLTITSDKSINIDVQDEDGFTLLADKEIQNFIGPLIKVEEGANVTFSGILTISGRYNAGGIIDNKGSVDLKSNVKITRAKITANSTGIIQTSGANARFTLDGGIIENNEIQGARYAGTVLVKDGAKLLIHSGAIRNNRFTGSNIYDSSPGVVLYENASAIMDGGEISGNAGYRGSGIMLYSLSRSKAVDFTLSGGAISSNVCSYLGEYPSGALHVEGNAQAIMNAGVIKDNKGGSGGGVCVVDPAIQNKDAKYNTSFIMNGGSITGNTAYAGAGIYSYSDDVQLNAGIIKDNVAAKMGGGIYSEGNANDYSTLHMNNAIITGNIASLQGGGMWYCPTGEGRTHITSGSAVYANAAKEAGDDVVSAAYSNSSETHSITLADRILGGGRVEWFEDGGVYMIGMGLYPSSSPQFPRYGDPNANTSPLSVKELDNNLALKSVADDSSILLAEKKARLRITGNTAEYGGGIAANGGIVVGSSDDNLKEILVEKTWDVPEGTELPEELTIDVRSEGGYIDSVTLTSEGAWKDNVSDIPEDMASDTITIEEDLDGYDMSYTAADDEDGNIVISVINALDESDDPDGTSDSGKTTDPNDSNGKGDPMPSDDEVTNVDNKSGTNPLSADNMAIGILFVLAILVSIALVLACRYRKQI